MRILLDVNPTYQRIAVLATGLTLLIGCGDSGKTLDNPLPKASQKLSVTAPWTDGARIPLRYTCDGLDVAPAVVVTPPPKHQAIVMTDPDAPGGTFVHWVKWGSLEGENSFGKTGYDGPCPPKGDSPHHYVLTAYELSSDLGLPAGTQAEKVLQTIQSKAVASGSTTGLYSR